MTIRSAGGHMAPSDGFATCSHTPITDSGGCLERSSPQLRQSLGPLLIFYSSPLSVFKLNGNSAVESMLESRGRTVQWAGQGCGALTKSNQYFKLCRPHNLCHNYLTLLMPQATENST